MLLAVTEAGAITGCVLGPASTDDRPFAAARCCWRRDPQRRTVDGGGPAPVPASGRRAGRSDRPALAPRAGAGLPNPVPSLGDGAFGGAPWTPHWRDDSSALVVRGSDLARTKDAPVRRQRSGWRQVIETVNGQLSQVLPRAVPGAKTRWGVLTRIAAMRVTVTLGLWLNHRLGRRPFALASRFGRSSASPV